MSDKNLNTAGKIAELFVTSKLTVLFMLSCVLLGVMAVLLTPREENPQIIVPGAEVFVSLPGATPLEMEQLVVNPLEAIIRELPGVDHTYAVAINSVAIINVQFEVGEDKEKSLVKLYDRVLGKRNLLPKDATAPLVKSVDVDDVPIVTVTLASDKYDDYALKRMADRMVERVRSLEAVSLAFVHGGRNREVRVELDPERLLAFGLTLDQIHNLLLAANVSAPVGQQVSQGKNTNIYVEGFLTSAEQVKKIIVASQSNQAIYLEDVADIIDGPNQERSQLSRFAYGLADPLFNSADLIEMPAVTMAVAKKPGTNAVLVATEVIKRLEVMKTNMLPDDIHMVVTRNDGVKANDAVNRLIEHLGIAILSVFIIVVFFLGVKEAIIVGVTVPFILALTLGADYLFGPTINRVTLFALILSLGLVVDAAIVVIENIHRHYNHLGAMDKREATILATNEIGNPTNLATFTIILVFLSMSVLTGMVGQFFHPIAFNVPIAMLASLVVAYIVTPWAANKWLAVGEGRDLESHDEKSGLHTMYYRVISPLLEVRRYRYYMMMTVIILIILSIMQPAWQFIRPQGISGPVSAAAIPVTLLPKDSKNTFNITIDLAEYSPVEITDKVAREIGELLRQEEYVVNYQSWIGQAGIIDFNGLLKGANNKSGSYVGEIRVNLTDKNTRSSSSIDIATALRPKLLNIQKRYPGSVIQLQEDPPGPPLRAIVMAEVYGEDPKILREISEKVSEAFNSTYGMIEVKDSEMADIRQYTIVVDKEKAALSGVTTAQVAQTLNRLISGEEMGRLHIGSEKHVVPIRLHIPRRYQVNPALLSSIFISNQKGDKIPLSELTQIINKWQDRPIYHKDYERVTFIGGEVSHTKPVYAVLELDEKLNNMPLSDGTFLSTENLSLDAAVPNTTQGYQLFWDGEMRLTLDAFRDLLGAFVMALLLIYLLLVAYYGSFSIPLIAMSAIPLGLIGVFPGHWLMDATFSTPSMIGIITLAGVVVRNSLLIIDFILDYMKKGLSLDIAVREAGAVRLRPILLTALAIILGSAIMLSDPVFGGLAISLIFGTISSTIFTLLVVPALFYSMMTRRNKKNALGS